MKSRENEINLLPNDYIKAKQRFWIRQIVGVLLDVEVALFIWGIVVPSKQKVQSLQIELEVSRQQMNISGFEQVDKVTSQLEEMEKQLQEWNICHSLLERENMI